MIKFLDLKKINKPYEIQLEKVFKDFLNSGNYILGDHLLKFEKEFANYCATKFCVGISNGLDALQLIFEAYKVLGKLEEGDEVIVPANTCIASVLAISNSKLKPVLVEPDINSFNIDIGKIESVLTKKTKAILGVHLYGLLYDVSKLETIAQKNNLLLIEDSAQAHGATFIDGRKAGNVSDVAGFSFYPTKNLGALGDAGAITTNNKELAEVIYKLRNYGKDTTSFFAIKGYNSRMDELQAAFLRIKLKHLDTNNNKRRLIAEKYINSIQNKNIILPKYKNIEAHVFHLFVIRSKFRDKLKSYLLENGVNTLIHYPVAIHNHHAYKELNTLSLPITNKLHNEILSIPAHHMLEDNEVEKIIYLLSNF